MKQISISSLRQNVSSIINQVYFGKEFEITKNSIPVARLVKTDKKVKKKTKRKISPEVFGMWKDREDWKGLSTIEIADKLRELAWKGSYGD